MCSSVAVDGSLVVVVSSCPIIITVEVMDIQGHTPFKARGGLGVAGYGLDMV